MGYFVELAKNIPARTDDKRAQLLRDSLLNISTKLYAEFEQTGELGAYTAVRIDDLYNDLPTMLAQSTDETPKLACVTITECYHLQEFI